MRLFIRYISGLVVDTSHDIFNLSWRPEMYKRTTVYSAYIIINQFGSSIGGTSITACHAQKTKKSSLNNFNNLGSHITLY